MNLTITYNEIKKLPVLIIDGFYTDEESNIILSDLKELNEHFTEDTTKNGSAWYKNEQGEKIYKKNARGCILDEIYKNNREESKILTINRKIFDSNFMQTITNFHYFFKYFRISNVDSTILHYYENDGEYKFHEDNATITIISWFYHEPKKFSNGNFIIDSEEKLLIECMNKRMVIFPSILEHAVEKVIMKEEYKNKNLGRYSMAQFLYLK